MNARLVITQETRAKLNNSALSPMRKRKLREELIKDSIRHAVDGMRTKQELIVAAGHSSDARSQDYSQGFTLVNSMIKKGLISHNRTNQFKKIWSVKEDVHVTPSPKEIAAVVVAEPTTEPEVKAEIAVELKDKVQVNKGTLLNLAKEFAWEKNSDSLREFIEFAKNRLK